MTKTTRYAANTAAAALAALALGLAAPAGAYTVSGTLTGDPRADSPDGLSMLVTVVVGADGMDAPGCAANTGASCSYWTVDLTMDGVHNHAKLHEFYFSLGQADGVESDEPGKFTDATFSNFDPGNWQVFTPASEQGPASWGSDGFLFEADVNGSSSVDNDTNLTFNMTLEAGETFDIAGASNDFVGDHLRLSSHQEFDGEWQMGAHIGGIGYKGEDSGFALGKFNGEPPDEPPDNPPGVPEPGTMALFGLGLVGLRLARRRRMA